MHKAENQKKIKTLLIRIGRRFPQIDADQKEEGPTRRRRSSAVEQLIRNRQVYRSFVATQQPMGRARAVRKGMLDAPPYLVQS